MHITALAIADVKLIVPKKFGDDRGFFSETFSRAWPGCDVDFVQDNHSRSAKTGTLRGLHYQAPPFAQDKLIRVVRGRIFDVAVDIRKGSPTFGRHVAAELSAENWAQLLVPAGFAHGFVTLEPDTEVIYKVTALYAPKAEAGIIWNDPDLGIAWPVAPAAATLSAKDTMLPRLKDAVSPF
jgi:dTDP-4-dehydrorhamnose 3,5-epimerase